MKLFVWNTFTARVCVRNLFLNEMQNIYVVGK